MPKIPRTYPDLTPVMASKFWNRVDIGEITECWEWRGMRTDRNYGIFHCAIDGKGYNLYAHRVAYELVKHEKCGKLHACHVCDNPPCVNPAHIFLGTHLDNMRDNVLKGRPKGPASEQASKTKLTPKDVLSIRSRYKPRVITCAQLAKEYGITPGAIHAILIRKSWKDT